MRAGLRRPHWGRRSRRPVTKSLSVSFPMRARADKCKIPLATLAGKDSCARAQVECFQPARRGASHRSEHACATYALPARGGGPVARMIEGLGSTAGLRSSTLFDTAKVAENANVLPWSGWLVTDNRPLIGRVRSETMVRPSLIPSCARRCPADPSAYLEPRSGSPLVKQDRQTSRIAVAGHVPRPSKSSNRIRSHLWLQRGRQSLN